jgi:hypothetical protein
VKINDPVRINPKNPTTQANEEITEELTPLALSQLSEHCTQILLRRIRDSKRIQAQLLEEMDEEERAWISKLYGQ